MRPCSPRPFVRGLGSGPPGRRSLFLQPSEIAGMLSVSPSLAPRKHCDPGGMQSFTTFPARPAGRPGRGPISSGNGRFPTSLKVQVQEGFFLNASCHLKNKPRTNNSDVMAALHRSRRQAWVGGCLTACLLRQAAPYSLRSFKKPHRQHYALLKSIR